MSDWEDAALKLLNTVQQAEARDFTQHKDEEVKRGIISARNSIVVAASYLSSVNGYLSSIRTILIVGVCLLAYIAYRLT